jgi:enoyl-CoA hydratase/carnithine racemase
MTTSSLRETAAILVETAAGVTRLTLNRPDKRNALSRELLAELGAELARISEDRETRVVVLAANGPVFSAGHDLGEMRGLSETEYRALFADCSQVMLQLRRLPQPVIARVHGLATAAGCQLVAACDLVVAADTAQFATPGVKIGLFCTTPMVPLVRAIPPKAALEMLMLGTPITARRAYELGLVNRVVTAAELDAAVQQYVDGLLASSPLVLQLGKRAFYDQLALDEETAYHRAIDVVTENAVSADAQEGFAAFLQKRKPQWRGV